MYVIAAGALPHGTGQFASVSQYSDCGPSSTACGEKAVAVSSGVGSHDLLPLVKNFL